MTIYKQPHNQSADAKSSIKGRNNFEHIPTCPWWRSDGGIYGLQEYIEAEAEEEKENNALSSISINDKRGRNLKSTIRTESNTTTTEKRHPSISSDDNSDQSVPQIDLSFWPLVDDDLVSLVRASNTRHIQGIKLQGCTSLTDHGIDFIAKNWSFRGVNSPSCEGIKNKHKVLPLLNRNLGTLILAGCIELTDQSCHSIGSHFPLLKTLDLSDCCNVTDLGVDHVLTGCKYLGEIRLRNLIRLNDGSIMSIQKSVETTKKLSHIDISGCTGFSNEALIQLLECDQGPLHYLDLSYCKQIDIGLIGLQSTSASSSPLSHTEIISSPTKLTTLKLRGLPKILDSAVKWIGDGCKLLQNIDLSDCHFVSDFSLNHILQGCVRLKILRLNRCSNITDASFDGINLPSKRLLRDIQISDCYKVTGSSISSISVACPSLKVLNLFGVPLVDDTALINIAKNCIMLTELNISSNLTILDHSCQSHVPKIGPVGLRHIGEYCHALKYLRCNGVSRVNDSCIITIARGCPFLEELQIQKCYQVTDKALQAIGKHCHSLRQINISLCKRISDDGIISLKGCPNLESIECSCLELVSDRGILFLCLSCKRLRQIIARKCFRLSDKSCIAIASCCDHLEKLNMYGIDLTNTSLKYLYDKRQNRSIRFVDFGASDISEQAMVTFANASTYCYKVRGKSILHPLYRNNTQSSQHTKFMKFIERYQYRIWRCMKTFLLQKQIESRVAIKQCSSVVLQRSIRRFYSTKLGCRLEERRRLELSAATLLGSFARCILCRKNYLKKRDSCVLIQGFFRRQRKKMICSEDERLKRLYLNSKRRRSSCCSMTNISLYGKSTVSSSLAQFIEQTQVKSQSEEQQRDLLQKMIINIAYTSLGLRFFLNCLSMLQLAVSMQISLRKNQATKIIQIHWRKMKREEKLRKERENIMATRLQLWLRRKTKELKLNDLRRRIEAGCTIQTWWRNKRKWDQTMFIIAIERNRQNIHLAKSQVASSIGRHWRLTASKRLFESLLEEKRQSDETERRQQALLLIQSWWRMMLANQIYKHKYQVVSRMGSLAVRFLSQWRNNSARVIQRSYLRFFTLQQRHNAARILSRFVKMVLRKKHMQLHLRRTKQRKSSILIQSEIRRYLCCNHMKNLRLSSSIIQRAYRQHKRYTQFKELMRLERQRLHEEEVEIKQELRRLSNIRMLEEFKHKLKDKAARKIQAVYSEFITTRRNALKIALEEKEKRQMISQEAEVMNDIVRHKQESRSMKAVSKKILRKTIRLVGDKLPTSINKIKKRFSQTDNDAVERQRLLNEIIKLKLLGVSDFDPSTNTIISSYNEKLMNRLGHFAWFDVRLEKLSISYALLPSEILHLHEVWTEYLDYRDENSIHVLDFFDFVGEERSSYGSWLFEAVDTERTDRLTFSEFCHVVTYYCMLGKNELVKFIFASYKHNALSKQQWIDLIDIMLSKEKLQYSKKSALIAFDNYSTRNSDGQPILLVQEFMKIAQQLPFIGIPMVRLQTKMRKKSLGENFWRQKINNIAASQVAISKS